MPENILSDDTEEKLQTVMQRAENIMKRFNLTRSEAFQILGLAYQEKAEKRGAAWGRVWAAIKAGASALAGELSKPKVE